MDIAHFIMRYCPRALVVALMVAHLGFVVAVVLWPVMALHHYAAWWVMFKWTFGICVAGCMVCYFAALVVRTKEIVLPKPRAIVHVDIDHAARQLANKARKSALKHGYTMDVAAQFLYSMLDTQKYKFDPYDRGTMYDITVRAAEILTTEYKGE